MPASVRFAARGTALAARYSNDGATPNGLWSAGTNLGGTVASSGVSNEISSSSFKLNNSGSAAWIAWNGGKNWIQSANGFSILWRGTIQATGTFLTLFSIGFWNQNAPGTIQLNWSNGSPGTLNLTIMDYVGNIIVNNVASTSGMTTGTYYDIVLTWDHSTTAGAIKLYVNASTVNTFTAGHAIASIPYPVMTMVLGGAGLGSSSWVNEFVVWDGVIDPTNVTLTGGAGQLNGASRSQFVDCIAFDGSVNADPGIANVRNATNYTIAGVAKTGTAVIPTAGNVRSGTSVDATTGTLVVPTVSQVKTGVSFDTSSTGTYDGSDRWTDPGDNNVRNGTAYKANSTTNNKTGRVTVPTAANVKTGVTFETDAGTTGTYDGSDRNTDPGQANVRLATAYKSNSLTNNKTGTMIAAVAASTKIGVTADDGAGSYDGSDRWTDPGQPNVRLATAYKANSTSNNKTGTLIAAVAASTQIGVTADDGPGSYDGSDRNTDPGQTNVRLATAYKSNSLTNNKTGSLAVPSADDVRDGVAVDATTGNVIVPDVDHVAKDFDFDSNGSLTGTLQNVTNVIAGATLKGQNTTATLTEG